MRTGALCLALVALAACGSDTVSSRTADIAAANVQARDAAQAGRIDNPAAIACVRQNASDDEWAKMSREDEVAVATLQTILDRPGTMQCFRANNVVVSL